MKKLKLLAFVFIGLSVAIVSCKKGDTGPAGAAGAAGPAGPDSVYYSSWAAVSTPFAGLSGSDSVFEQIVTATAITQTILDQGMILTYIQLADGTVSDVADFSSFLDVYYGVGTVTLDSYGLDLSQFGWSVRFVAIPGVVLSGNSVLKNYTKEQLKTVNYSVIAKALNLNTAKAKTTN
jgi:hypothetical protein